MKRGNKPKFSREKQQRKALMKALLTSLIEHGRIRTTETRAKSLCVAADKMVTKAKSGTVYSRRLLLQNVGSTAAAKLTKDIAPRMAERNGGYTRIVHLGRRVSDAAPMAIVEFIQ